MRKFAKSAFAMCCFVFATIAPEAAAAEGRVVEKGTGAPIAGVFVIARWDGQVANPVDAKSICYDAKITTTNAKGEFDLPRLSTNVNPMIVMRRRSLELYKPGYREVDGPEPNSRVYYFERRTRPADIKFDDIWRMRPPFNCGMDDKDLVPLLKAYHRELDSLASTKEERKQTRSLLFTLENIEFGEEVASRNLVSREREAMQSEGKR